MTPLLRASTLLSLALACGPAAEPPPPAAAPAAPSAAPPPAIMAAAPSPLPAAPPIPPPAPRSLTEEALAEWSRSTQCSDFDYFPKGGIQNFWCHRPVRVTIAALRGAAGEIFASGPHHGDTLDLGSRFEFGHYSPAFVTWLLDKAGPSERGTLGQEVTQTAYDTSLRPLARIFWQTHQKMVAEAECAGKERAAYQRGIANRTLPAKYYERWFFFMNPFFCDKTPHKDTFYFDNGMDGGVDGNVTKTVVGFWFRRQLDGTEAGFVTGLQRLLAAYDPGALTVAFLPSDGAGIQATVKAAMKAASSCKIPGLPAQSTFVDITVSPSGVVTAPSVRTMAGPDVAACVDAALGALHAPAFTGDALHFNRKIMLPMAPRPRGGRSPLDGSSVF